MKRFLRGLGVVLMVLIGSGLVAMLFLSFSLLKGMEGTAPENNALYYAGTGR